MKVVDFCLWIILILCVCTLAGTGIYEYNKMTYEYSLPYVGEKFIEGDYATWDQDVVNVTVMGDCPDWNKLQDVLNEWNEVMPGNVPRLAYNSTYPDIYISWKPEMDEDWAGGTWWVVDDEEDTIEEATIVIRTSWSFSREHVIRHELGHAMGLSYHSNHPNSTMYKYANGVNKWSDEDINMLSTIYGN